ncbi:MAG: hypothetical protein RL331_384 [Bacteroidota bacterium]|jgi:hypothetical protein
MAFISPYKSDSEISVINNVMNTKPKQILETKLCLWLCKIRNNTKFFVNIQFHLNRENIKSHLVPV